MKISRPFILLPIAVVIAGLVIVFSSSVQWEPPGATLAEPHVSTARSDLTAFDSMERPASRIDASHVGRGSDACDVAELRAAQQEFDQARRHDRLKRLGMLFASQDLEFAQNAVAQLTRSGDKFAFLSGMIDLWMEVNAESALNFLHNLPASSYRPHVAVQALGILARSDAQRAFDWMPKLVSGFQRDNAAMKIISTLASYDLSSALDYANAQRSSQGREAFAEMAVSEATQVNSTRAREMLDSRSDLATEVRQSALNALAGVWALEEGSDATNWAENIFSQTGSSRPLELALINWATVDAPAAANALSGHLGESWSAGAAEEIATSWADQDLVSAARWVATLPDSPSRDAALNGFVAAWSQNDPLAALKWAVNLPPNEPARDSSIVQAGSAVSANEPSALDAFVRTLPHTQRIQLKQMMETASHPRTTLFTEADSNNESDEL